MSEPSDVWTCYASPVGLARACGHHNVTEATTCTACGCTRKASDDRAAQEQARVRHARHQRRRGRRQDEETPAPAGGGAGGRADGV